MPKVFAITAIVVATIAVNFWILLVVAITARPSGALVGTNTGVWRAAFLMILFTMLVITVAMVKANWRSRGSTGWRTVWNVAELLWVVGAVFSLVAALQETDKNVRPEIAAILAADTENRRAALAREADQLLLLACNQSTAGPACSLIDAARTPEGQRQVNIFDFNHIATMAQDRAVVSEEVGARLHRFVRDWFEVGEAEGLERYEDRPIELPSWLRVILLFAPHVLAFVFPLKLGRTLVAFRS